MNIFSIAPLALCHESSRLTLIETRILLALLSFRAANTDLVWPRRSQIAERTGYTEQTISRATTKLARKGWLEKEGDGGRGRACRYRITVPEPETVSTSETVSEPGTKTVSEPGTKRCPNPTPTKRTDQEQTTNRPTYRTRKGKNLTGYALEAFETFWRYFSYPKGKAAAADVWREMFMRNELTPPVLDRIFMKAKEEAFQRSRVIAAGMTPIYAQGWLSGRRWEDDDVVTGLKQKYEHPTTSVEDILNGRLT